MFNSWFRYAVAAFAIMALAACTGADSTLGIATQNSTELPPVPAAQSTIVGNNVYFAPIVGAPVAQVTALSRQLSTAAPTLGVTLKPQQAPDLTHEIRGYFSALSEGGTITIIHVWDVFDTQGARVHRIQGQQVIPGNNATDPWSAVPATTMETIATKVLTDYTTWRATLS